MFARVFLSFSVLVRLSAFTLGIGPVLFYISPPIGGHVISAELKWLPELDVQNHLEGDYIWFKVAFVF